MSGRGPRRQGWASLIGGGLLAGWVAQDLAVLATSHEPHLALRILPRCVLLVLVGAALAAALERWRAVAWALLVALLAAICWPGAAPDLPPKGYQALASLLVAGMVLRVGSRLAGRAPAWAALGLGAAMAAAWETKWGGPRTTSLVVAAAGATLVSAWLLPQPRIRAVLATGALVAAIGFVGFESAQRQVLARPARSFASAPAGEAGSNLLLIVLDTVRADRLAPYGHPRATTPRLDAFVERYARIYTDARSASSWTLPSHASILTGRMPGEHGATHERVASEELPVRTARFPAYPLRKDVPTLAELLAARGYRTAGIVANHAYLSHHFGLDRGFEHYDDRRGALIRRRFTLLQQLRLYPPSLAAVGYRDAESMTDEAIGWLERRDRQRPFFLFLNYMDAHRPLVPPPPFDAAFEDRRPRNPIKPEEELLPLQYERSLLYLDHHLGRLLAWVEAEGLLASTLVVITSDHGEDFGERGLWGHDKTLYESVIRVPLYVKPAGSERGSVRATGSVSGADVFYLIARELGLGLERAPGEAPVAEWYRSSELDEESAHDLDRDLLAWTSGKLKFIVSSHGEVEVYDLADDPAEERSLAVEPAIVERARATARRWWDAHPPLAPPEGELDPEVAERLRALGYLQ